VIAKTMEAVQTFNRYPDMGVGALHEALAAKVGVDVGRIASGAGSVAVLYHLLQAMCGEGDEVVYAWRSFEAYPIAVGLTGAHGVQVPLTPAFRHDLPAMRAAVTDRTKVVVVCTPNNPTGPAVHRDELLDLIESVPRDVVVVIDEAYREFVTDPLTGDGLELAADRDNVVVLRTFSKAYGLAGLRIGYAIAPVAAVASLEAEPELLARVASLVTERARVLAALQQEGWVVPEAQGNFVWLPLGTKSVEFAEACDVAGVSVRPFAGDGVRVSIGEPEANDIFLGVAAARGSADLEN
jgi:histidinol-phosphate aminotransferase